MSICKNFKLWVRIFALAFVVGVSCLVQPVLAHSIPMTDRQMVHESEHIVVAIVENGVARWNPQHTLIFTDYTLRIEDRLKGEATERMTLSVPGGTLDGETHETCLSTPLAQGERYLLFLGDLTHPTLAPITGAQQGIFREMSVTEGKRYAAVGNAKIPLLAQGKPVEFRDFVEGVRSLVSQVLAHPETGDDPVKSLGGTIQHLPAKDYDPEGKVEKGSSSTEPLQELGVAPSPPWMAQAEYGELAGPNFHVISPSVRSLGEKYVVRGRPSAPIIFNNFPAGFPFAPYDQYQMAYWNVYAKNLFRVYARPTGTWSFGNGVFDLAGFPLNDQMIQQFGAPWGGTTLGITYARPSFNGTIIEADVALNPYAPWTLDDRTGTTPGQPISFEHVMLHELGHTWGLQHPWESQNVWWDSIMNYTQQQYYVARLWADDTMAARAAYPGISIRDGAISSYTTQDSLFSNNADYIPSYPSPTVVVPGGSFTVVNPIKLENTGTVNLVNPTIEVYLVPQRFSFSGAILLRSLRYSTTVKPNYISRLLIGTLTVPSSVRSGTYYLAFFYRDARDRYQNNNSAWSNYNVTLQVYSR